MLEVLTERQAREIDYHKDHAATYRSKYAKIDFEVVSEKRRRWWNQSWSMYSELMSQELAGKRVLVVGCGFGDDCFQLAKLGAKVFGFDLSADLLEVGREVAIREGLDIEFDVMPAEKLTYPDNFFDVVLCRDILHHVEIPQALSEISRVCKPNAAAIFNEVYTHSLTDKLRKSWLVQNVLYNLLVRVIYGKDKPYITEDERKMNENDMRLVYASVAAKRVRYFDFVVNRVLPKNIKLLSQIDYTALNGCGLAEYLGGRVLLTGQLKKPSQTGLEAARRQQ